MSVFVGKHRFLQLVQHSYNSKYYVRKPVIPLTHPVLPPSLPPPTKRRRVSKSKYSVQEEDHMTGCARSEGYYKIDMREKVKYLPHHRLKSTSSTTAVPEPRKTVSHSV